MDTEKPTNLMLNSDYIYMERNTSVFTSLSQADLTLGAACGGGWLWTASGNLHFSHLNVCLLMALVGQR